VHEPNVIPMTEAQRRRAIDALAALLLSYERQHERSDGHP